MIDKYSNLRTRLASLKLSGPVSTSAAKWEAVSDALDVELVAELLAERDALAAPAAEVPEAMGDERAEFEAWLISEGGWVAVPEKRASGAYVNGQAQARWIGWNARAARDAQWQSTRLCGGVPEGEQRNREADRARFPDPNFNRWLDEAITENGEYTAWHALQSTGDAYAGWCVRPDYTGPAPEGHALVPVEPTPEMIEAARNVKRQRLVRAAADIKKGKHPDTIGMALSVNEEWTAKLTAAPQAPALDAGVVRDAEVPPGFVPLQRENGKLVYAACMDGGRFNGWLMWKHPDGQWVSKRKLEAWEVMQVEDQDHYGIVQDAAMSAQAGGSK